MSVINKMLQDLEQRQQPQVTASNRQYPPQPGRGSKTVYIWLVLLLVFIMLSVLWFSQRAQPQAVFADSNGKVTAATSEQVKVNIEQSLLTDSAEPATIMAALTVEPARVAEPTSNTELTEMAETAEPAAIKQLATQPVSALTEQVAIVSVAEPEVSAVLNSQAIVDKQPLSAEAEQHNMLLRANASEAAGDTSGAIVIWQQIVARQPAEAIGYLNLARLWLKQQQIVSASQVLLQARQNGVLSAEINMQLAQLAVRQGQWQQALEFLPDQFELAAEPEYFGFKATVLQQVQQHDEALQWYQRLQQLQPEQGRWSLGAALASEQLGQPQQAHQYYQHAWLHRQALSVSSHNFIQQRLKATEP
ncbi:hypothetical protein [Arsukibacterium perlucidum]|uniref:hypothetical protein n=1 Tax=Arsukibacterium perlucidum TaxID=368811 RepID=UPI0003659CEA|nr:hypothetical protein [Arsukibacterium perlucidum]